MKIFLVVALVLAVQGGLSAATQTFEDLEAAYNHGDYATALRGFRHLAEQGYAEAQFILGIMYDNGKGVAKDAAEAAKWFRRAAEQGHAKAQFNLGIMYARGEGVAEDGAEAAKWFRRAAEQGYAEAQFILGIMYDNGEGVPKDVTEAVKWFRRAAEQGNAEAQFLLGSMYTFGRGCCGGRRRGCEVVSPRRRTGKRSSSVPPRAHVLHRRGRSPELPSGACVGQSGGFPADQHKARAGCRVARWPREVAVEIGTRSRATHGGRVAGQDRVTVVAARAEVCAERAGSPVSRNSAGAVSAACASRRPVATLLSVAGRA